MIVESITLKNFRNHTYLSYDFSPKMNLLIGDNGVGKTNVVEAIYLLALGRSFRTNEDTDLIQYQKESAVIDATIKEGTVNKKIKIVLSKDFKKIYLNGKSLVKINDLMNACNIVLFEPKDALLFKGLPKARRNFLDINLCKKSESYLAYLSQYDKVLKQRNNHLKSNEINETLLEAEEELLAKYSGPIIAYRQQYVKDINNILNKIIRALTCDKGELKLNYEPFIPFCGEFQEKAKEAFKKAREGDLKRKATSIGVHREDLSMSLNGRDIAEFGSQGENRIAVLALKLSSFFLIEDKEKRPIVLLDDVMSELDKEHQKRLIAFLLKFGQVFITGTNLSVKEAKTYILIKKGDKLNGRE